MCRLDGGLCQSRTRHREDTNLPRGTEVKEECIVRNQDEHVCRLTSVQKVGRRGEVQKVCEAEMAQLGWR